MDSYGLVIASDRQGAGDDEELAGAVATNVSRTASQGTVEMGLGPFEEGLLEGESSNLHIRDIGEMILGVLAERGVKLGMLEKQIREFAERIP